MEPSPESGLRSTPWGVHVILRSEEREELDLGKLVLRVVTPEELRQRRVKAVSHSHTHRAAPPGPGPGWRRSCSVM